jgi:hypothetical protein
MFEVVIVKHGAMKWEWRVCNREGTFLMSGWGPTQAAPAICCVTHCPQKWEFLHHQFGVVDDGQPEFDGKQVEFDSYMLIGTFRGKPHGLSGSL